MGNHSIPLPLELNNKLSDQTTDVFRRVQEMLDLQQTP